VRVKFQQRGEEMKTLLAVLALASLTAGCHSVNDAFRTQAQQSLKDIAAGTFEKTSGEKLASTAKSPQEQVFAKQILTLATSYDLQRVSEHYYQIPPPPGPSAAELRQRLDAADYARKSGPMLNACLLALQTNLQKDDLSEPTECTRAHEGPKN